MAFKLNPAAFAKPPVPQAAKVLEPTAQETRALIAAEVHRSDGESAVIDSAVDGFHEPVVIQPEDNYTGDRKLSALVDDDFPFDESQLVAINGIVSEKYACMTGAAGTGKTTCTKKIVDSLLDQGELSEVDMTTYWKKSDSKGVDADDDYEVPEDYIPSVVMCSFTGRSTQMTKKNFPRDWHGNIMTIHRMLGFMPEFYEDFDEESGEVKNKMRFIPTYNSENKLPWDIIIIDEAGMLGLDLWHQLWAACRPTTRIIMIGDINQLPPTHGKSIFGFALSEWPSWELTHVHRQAGANNSIVDNAHRILRGLEPISDCPDKKANFKDNTGALAALNFLAKDKEWKFCAFEVVEDSRQASIMIRKVMKLMQGKLYEPNRDALITPINGFESTSTGYMLGQEPLNRELAITLNAGQPRFLIDAGRDRKNFAEGDKVMATRNDYEAGITNGMTGIIESIARHGGYQGESRRWGLISEVQDYLEEIGGDDDGEDFSLEDLATSHEELEEGAKHEKEGRAAGPASHIIKVKFGEGEHSFTIDFQSQAEVASLQLAYASTCHKLQGGEAPLVCVIVHQSHKRPLNREWLYTAVTRASQRCIVFYTRQGMGFARTKQNIKGSTLRQKVESFQALQKVGMLGAALKVRIPESPNKGKGSLELDRKTPDEASRAVAIQEAIAKSIGGVKRPELKGETIRRPEPRPEIHIHLHQHAAKPEPKPVTPAKPVDGGELKPTFNDRLNASLTAMDRRDERLRQEAKAHPMHTLMHYVGPTQTLSQALALPAPKPLMSQWGAVRMAKKLEAATETRLLPYYPPAPVEAPKVAPALKGLAALIAKQKAAGK